jgi:hypothetical protein
MGDKKKYQIWGYPAKTTPDWNHQGKWIGSADDIEEARKLKGNATIAGWGTVLVLEGDSIVE